MFPLARGQISPDRNRLGIVKFSPNFLLNCIRLSPTPRPGPSRLVETLTCIGL